MSPNLFLLAAPRSGSTQLSAWLASHPDIDLPAIKEPNHFSEHEFPEDFVRDTKLNDVVPEDYVARLSKKQMQFAIFRKRSHYEYLFEDLTSRWIMDASTTYLHCPEAAAKIKAYAPNAKLIILTRDPVSRALSHYRLATRIGQTTRTLKEELEAEVKGVTPLPGRFLLRPSRHGAAIERYRDMFPESQILEVTFEDLISDTDNVLRSIAVFLNISKDDFNISVEKKNSGDSPRFRSLNAWLMSSGIKTRLRRILPTSVKSNLKRIYFKPNTEKFSHEDIALLSEHLGSK